MRRVVTISRSAVLERLVWLVMVCMAPLRERCDGDPVPVLMPRASASSRAPRLLLSLKSAQIVLQPVEPFLPQLAVFLHEVGNLGERGRRDATWPPLRLAPL